MLRVALNNYLVKAVLVALVALVLFGVVSGTELAIILTFFAGLRLISLVAEGLPKQVSPKGQARTPHALIQTHEKFTQKERADDEAPGLGSRLSAVELATPPVRQIIDREPLPRTKMELWAEAFGVVAFALFIPLNIALYTRDFFSLRTPQGWAGAVVVALCLALYAWPHRWLKSPGFSKPRSLLWALPCALALPLLSRAIETRHPYLDPFNPEHKRLAAERVLALKDNVVAGRHADWVSRYARQLDEQGKWEQAMHFYHESLRLDSNNRQVSARLASLSALLSPGLTKNEGKLPSVIAGPYWTTDKPVIKPPRCRINEQLESVESCTVVIVSVGEISDELADAVGYVIHNELNLTVYISQDPVTLPEHTRVRGLLTGRQWDQNALVKAFIEATKVFPKAPIKYVLLTPVDIYSVDANFVFSCTSDWGALVSSARFGQPTSGNTLLFERTAKQALCALLKSFKVPISTNPKCVTSYTRTLPEFDAKGNRPDAETLGMFRQAVAALNTGWQNHKARPLDTKP